MDKLIIEASINESARKEDNPNIPYGPEEGARDGIACAKAGAAIIHYHARDQVSGENLWDKGTETYLECYRLIRQECPDVIVYPTQRGYRLEDVPHVFELARDPDEGLELATVDVFPTGGFTRDDSSVMVTLMQELRKLNVAYSLGVRDIGHMRHIARYHDMGLVGDTLILKIFWNEVSVGPVPGMRGLQMYLDAVPTGVTCQWFNTVYDGAPDLATLRRTSMLAAATGGHIRTGIGENPMLDGRRGADAYTNVDHVAMAVELGLRAGREIATPDDARAILGMPPRHIGKRAS
ncbi:MAG TPA: 3-keto-5-aminohexanoate cleavage protein [Acidimicrobiales bacterium]|jgi:3-keto-5-aminohexanoate cleavage enzyme|nr:3-keto-5-aminohexanoate cleavage protein [Acidimicrobiales bacterium]